MNDGGRAKVGRPALRLLGPGAAALLRHVGRAARFSGGRAYLVGGPVRDLLLGRESRDLDVVVEGDAIAVGRRLRDERGGRLVVHRAFGNATLVLDDGCRLDLATARRESYAAPAALPGVTPAGIEEDLWRRDFSINCLALELSRARFGTLLDPTGGREDLRRRRIRALHDRSFIDDPTRGLRAVAFASRLAFRIEARTADWIAEANRRGVMRCLSSARLRRVFSATLDEPDLLRTVGLLRSQGLLRAIDPALARGPVRRRVLRRIAPLVRAGGPALALALPPRWLVIVALLSLEQGWRQRDRIWRRLQPPRRWARVARVARREVALIRRHLAPTTAPSRSRVLAACRRQSGLVVLLVAATEERRGVRESLLGYLTRWAAVRPDIDGRDLLAAGVAAGPAISRALDAALALKLERPRCGRRAQLQAALAAAGLGAVAAGRLTESRGID